MKHIKLFEEIGSYEPGDYKPTGYKVDDVVEVKFVGIRNPALKFSVFKDKHGKIVDIKKIPTIRFPYRVGENFGRSIEIWACNNNFIIDGKNMCPEEKIFGVRKKDIPSGHPLRYIYPNKFK